ncbi:hypothetical protein BP6252_08160 [Coleophoma cylindrospora]|uniref:Uncharacterized protein n=1 Tax=Coleophoma cylindrospora TaxID=1849047 RepID=A0A3D8RC13_9HELO|nr:hypothetical protein BP6252_08160 [Coleophoma cylindrospora]
MAPPYPSIQSFYKREVPVPKSTPATTGQGHATSSIVEFGDGYTEDEVAQALDPLARKWNPGREYEERGINELTTGPKAVTFLGRIVNFNTVYGRSQKQPRASGWHYMLIKDDEACISVKLYFAAKPYPFKLGQLLTIWTAFIADASKADSNHAVTSMTANMFPTRVTSDHIMVHTPSTTLNIRDACRRPLACMPRDPLPDLMSLESYLTSGHDGVTGVKILVCVKSIGARKKLAKKGGGECELAEVMLFDHTAEAKLKLWGEMIDSAQDWMPSETILLISNPGFRAEYGGKGSVGIQMRTMVDVDPQFPDAKWLRGYAARLTKKESLGTEFPEGVFDVDAAEHGINKILFTIADVDEWLPLSHPHGDFTRATPRPEHAPVQHLLRPPAVLEQAKHPLPALPQTGDTYAQLEDRGPMHRRDRMCGFGETPVVSQGVGGVIGPWHGGGGGDERGGDPVAGAAIAVATGYVCFWLG